MDEDAVPGSENPPVTDLSESVWKQRFIARLAALFVQDGIAAEWARADAEAHAVDHFPCRTGGPPEREADAVHQWLLVDED